MKKLAIVTAAVGLAATFSTSAFAEKPRHDGGPRGPGIEELDTNGDGAVSRAEFEAGAIKKAARFFDKLDTNGDGVLTKADRKEHHERRDRSERRGEAEKGNHGHDRGEARRHEGQKPGERTE